MRYSTIAIVLVLAILATACAPMSVSDLAQNKAKYEGKSVSVSGIVKNTLKIGDLSGYTLQDKETDDVIAVRSDSLPAEGKETTAKGILIKDTLFGYYIKADE